MDDFLTSLWNPHIPIIHARCGLSSQLPRNSVAALGHRTLGEYAQVTSAVTAGRQGQGMSLIQFDMHGTALPLFTQ
jgi:hypothetical protein